MRDFQVWFYVLLGVIYLLSRFLKKPVQEKPKDLPDFRPEKPARRFEQPPVKPGSSPGKMLTFEELLREITEAKTQPNPQPTSLPKADVKDYDEEIEEEIQDLEDVEYDYKKDKVAVEYEAAKQQAFLRPSLEETLTLKDTDTRFAKFKVFEAESQPNLIDKYLGDFYDPEGLKKAIVLSEILQRKF
jgi:hypothetical protein